MTSFSSSVTSMSVIIIIIIIIMNWSTLVNFIHIYMCVYIYIYIHICVCVNADTKFVINSRFLINIWSYYRSRYIRVFILSTFTSACHLSTIFNSISNK
jgi:hypothetical protein